MSPNQARGVSERPRAVRAFAALALAVSVALLGPAALAQPIQSWTITLPAGGQRGDIAVRVTAPPTGGRLPILLFSHGAGYSKDDYGPLAQAWAGAGFAVLQPTHLDSRALNLAADDPRRASVWRSRRDDLAYLLDHAADIEHVIAPLAGRLDATRAVVAGHSFGGHTASLLLGARAVDPATGVSADLSDPRVHAGVLIAPPGGFASLSADWQARSPYLKVDWARMRRPVLVIVGSADVSTMNPQDYLWRAEAFAGAPRGAACLLVIDGAGHFMGGIGGGADSTGPDARPAAVRLVQQASLAWLSGAGSAAARADRLRPLVRPPDRLTCK